MGRLRGHSASILQLLVLGERLLSLGADRRLLVWAVGEIGAPQVPRPHVPAQRHPEAFFPAITVAGCVSRHAWHSAFSVPQGI